MSIVVGLDLSLTNAGIAVLTDGRPTLLTSVGHGGRDGASYDERSRRIVSQARAIMAAISSHVIDLAVMEGPAYSQNLPSNHDRAGLWWGVHSALRARKVPVAVMSPTSRSSWATGRGRAPKAIVVEHVRATWASWAPLIANDDIADALTLAEAGARHLGEPLHFEPRRRHIEALPGITWPEMAA